MQTFLPYADFTKSALIIDTDRIGNQVYRECKTLINGGWPHHPASKMWRGYEYWLAVYALALLDDMPNRTKADGVRPKFAPDVVPRWREFFQQKADEHIKGPRPPWLGDERVHASHRGVMLWKNPEWYSQFGWTEQPLGPGPDGKFPYYWPV